tara:strand:+ start:2650 stop:4017 length:1368 start_codon:yes stop_codon:yes gene_type:complete
MEIIQSIIGFFIAIGILVTFHEYGHFITARLFNVTVLNFSIGFGKSIYKYRPIKSNTEYSIGLIPLGGYVKMLESDELEKIDKKNEFYDKEFCFDKQKVWKRFLIVAAGPIFNLLLAFIFFIFVHMNGMNGLKPLVESFNESNDPIFANNSIVEISKVNNVETKRWQDVRVEILNAVVKGDRKIDFIVVSNNGDQKKLSIDVDEDILKREGDIIKNLGIIQMNPELSTSISYVQNNSPASLAGFQINDEIISIDDVPVRSWNEYVKIIHDNPGNILQVGVIRDDKRIDLILVPSLKDINGKKVGFAGISPNRKNLEMYRVNVKYNFSDSVIKSIALTVDYTVLTLKMIIKLFTGQANVNNLSGPLSIAEFSGKSLSMGLVYFVYLMAILSISLGVLNLLPIPLLDGGHLVYYTFEMISGKPVSLKIQLIAQQVGIIILFGIMILAFYNDFLRIFK